MIVAAHAADSATPAPVPNGRARHTSQEPAERNPEPGRSPGCPRPCLSERALEHARRAAAQAPPLRPGTVERVRQILFGACDSAQPAGWKAAELWPSTSMTPTFRRLPNGRVQHTSRWSHLFADTQEELHAFAERLGLRRSYFQGGPEHGRLWHYDVTEGKRCQAIRLGASPVTAFEAVEIMHERDAKAERAKRADQASHAAGLAYRAGDYVKASRLLGVAREADPSRSPLWAERAARVHAAAREKAPEAAGPDDPRPLPAIVAARLEAAGIGADDPGVKFARAWNVERMSAAREAEPASADEPRPDLLTDAEREAGR